jgi:hypothetical protein
MSRVYDISFGKVTDAHGAPKRLALCLWRVRGPFKTFREAEQDAEKACIRAPELADEAKEARRAEIR